MARYIWFGGAWVPAGEVSLHRAAQVLAIHRDFDAPILCHADGKMHSSRSTYDAAVRAAGCEVIGKSEARRQLENTRPRGLGGEPVSATLRQILQQLGE